MNIIIASAEVTPFAKAGGLADVASSLPIGLQKYGQNPIIFMPKYKHIDVSNYNFKPTDLVLFVPMGNWIEFARLWYGKLPETDVPVYLIENNDYFDRDGIYGNPNEYPDNDRRFIFLSRAIFEAAKALNISPDIIHAHDFHTAFTMAFLKSQYRFDSRFSRTAGVYTIHNLAYQGWFFPDRAMEFSGFGIGEFYPGSWFYQNGMVNAMKAGIMFSDKLTTVSPTYAKEIRDAYFSEGLQDILNLRGADLIGILNGANYTEWNPIDDRHIFFPYNEQSLGMKRLNKHRFLNELGFTVKDGLDKPLIGVVSRLTEQKGIDLIMNKLEYYLTNDVFRFVLLGTGDSYYVDFFNYIAAKHPQNAIIHIGYNNEFAHRIISCSDFLMLPSRFEPCGLTQMYALKYGTVPIVRNTGGLADTVQEYIPETGKGNGFVFWHYNADDFAYSIRRALYVYNNEPHWNIIRRNAMAEDFSSGKTAMEYLKVYKWALEKVRR